MKPFCELQCQLDLIDQMEAEHMAYKKRAAKVLFSHIPDRSNIWIHIKVLSPLAPGDNRITDDYAMPSKRGILFTPGYHDKAWNWYVHSSAIACSYIRHNDKGAVVMKEQPGGVGHVDTIPWQYIDMIVTDAGQKVSLPSSLAFSDWKKTYVKTNIAMLATTGDFPVPSVIN